MTYSRCMLLSLRNLDLTRFVGYSFFDIHILGFWQRTVSRTSSYFTWRKGTGTEASWPQAHFCCPSKPAIKNLIAYTIYIFCDSRLIIVGQVLIKIGQHAYRKILYQDPDRKMPTIIIHVVFYNKCSLILCLYMPRSYNKIGLFSIDFFVFEIMRYLFVTM